MFWGIAVVVVWTDLDTKSTIAVSIVLICYESLCQLQLCTCFIAFKMIITKNHKNLANTKLILKLHENL